MSFSELLWAYLLVLLLAAVPFLEGYAVAPLAIIAGLATVPVFVLGVIGNVVTVALVIVFVNKIKEWRTKKKKETEEKAESKRSIRAQKIWTKYGLPGLAMIGPLFVGSHVTAFMSVSLGGTKKKALIWMTASITIWTVVFVILAHLGIDLLGHQEDGLSNRFFN
ncbi:small multi-drug export protein [Alkalihalobacillus sp. MEB130]|uniref:small multi-drug export protein n=1 Tax=Alkalihalobacillus sp. MEB130 TaxID=2976704 RepID=UPI0028E07E2C|nr:small multi-drug export protein [Alkalihalobacillus sp. MEB130]MDT8860545.1 small multi-drug export protein [Alkalihalobacillus sp. MEB130]